MARGRTHLYEDDLAWIHRAGYGFHWERAAPHVIELLRRCHVASGTVLDLGCGGGEWMAYLRSRGYGVCGVDVSASMVKAARRANPGCAVIHGSFSDVSLPACDAATSLGEPLNYLDGSASIKRTIRNVFRALRAGGVFVLDLRIPSGRVASCQTRARCGEDWACVAEISEDPGRGTIIRDITTFVRCGRAYRRGFERHTLHVYPSRSIQSWLRDAGFRVRTYRGYGDYRFTAAQRVFVARKPD